MSAPTSQYSFYDLIMRVAKEAGTAYYGSSGNERAMIPVDAHDLEVIRDLVNDGIKMFIADAPPKGWRWMRKIAAVTITGTRITGTADAADATSITDLTLADTYDADDDLNGYYCYILTGTGAGSYAVITDYTTLTGKVTVADWLDQYGNTGGTDPAADSTFAITPVETVGGDIARYPLPENFGGEVNGAIEYAADSSHGSPIEWVDEGLIRSMRSLSVTTGYPTRAAIRPLEYIGAVAGPKRRWELIVDPQPSSTEVLTFPYTLYFDKLRLESGLATNGAAAAVSDSSLANIYPNDYFNGWNISIISGTGKGATAIVTDYVGADGEWFVTDWLYSDGTAAAVNPASGSAYYVEPVANLHPAGFPFDEAILAACRAKAEMELEDVTAGWVQMYMQKVLPNAIMQDVRTAPRKLGSMNRNQRRYRERYWDDVTYE